MTKLIDLTEKRFGKLTAKRMAGRFGLSQKIKWECLCDCGSSTLVAGDNLRNKITESCGCLQKERTSNANTKHGRSQKTREYEIWGSMRKRCNNSNSEDYPLYGGRGIKVCDRWNSFENFIADMGLCPEKHSIDRIDVNKNYSPENCRWATATQQARNKRNNRWIDVDGVVKTMIEWSELSGVHRTCIGKRLRRGWVPAQAVWGKSA